MMSEEKQSSTDPGGYAAPGAGSRPVASPTVDENGNPKPRSFDTLVPAPEPDAHAPDVFTGGRQADTGESLRVLEEKKASDARRRRNRMIGIVAGFALFAALGFAVVMWVSHPTETVPGPVETVTVTVPVVTTVTVPVVTTVTVPVNTTPTIATVKPTASATVTARPSASAVATAPATTTAAPTTTASAVPTAKPSASHDPDYIREFHP